MPLRSKKRGNKIRVVILILCLIMPIVAAYTSMQYKKYLVKEEIKQQIFEGIDKSKLTLLIFSTEEAQTQLEWEDGSEFEYQDKMYDVVVNETRGDTIYYWCLLDDEETQLNKQLNNLVAQTLGNDAPQQENQRKLIEIYKSLYYLDAPESGQIKFFASEEYFSLCNFIYSSISLSPLVPPPKFS